MENKASGNQDIMYLLALLEDEIAGSKKAVFGGGRVIDAGKCQAILRDIRFNMPQALSHANAIIKERDNIMRDAKMRAERMLQDAESKANTLIDNHEIIAKAKEEADYIVAKAKTYSDFLTNETLSSIDQMLKRSEENFEDILDVVRNSRDDVRGMRRPEAHAPKGQAGSSEDYAPDYDYEREEDYDNDVVFTHKDN